MSVNSNITELLKQGDAGAMEELFPLVYNELRQIAAVLFRKEYREGHTLQPTALVHEAYIRLIGNGNDITWENQAHFFGIAARSMRQVLIDHARSHNAEKRGGGKTMVLLDDAIGQIQTKGVEIIALHEALEKFGQFDERQAQIVELKFFGGLKNEEIAEVLQISVSTITREWEMARIWLYRELNS